MFKVGDIVDVLAMTGFGDNSYHKEVTAEDTKYDPDTGVPYKIFEVDGHWFNESGDAWDAPFAYHIRNVN